MDLAKRDRFLAIHNADSYQYFAENDPDGDCGCAGVSPPNAFTYSVSACFTLAAAILFYRKRPWRGSLKS